MRRPKGAALAALRGLAVAAAIALILLVVAVLVGEDRSSRNFGLRGFSEVRT